MRFLFFLIGMLTPFGPTVATAQDKVDSSGHNYTTLSADSKQIVEVLKTKSAAELRTIFQTFDTKTLTGIDPGLPPKAKPPIWTADCSPNTWASAVYALETKELCELAGEKAKVMTVCAKAAAKQ